MRRGFGLALVLLLAAAAFAQAQGAGPLLPVRVDGFLLAPVEEALYKQIKAAQGNPQIPFTIAVDGAKPDALAVSREMLRDFQNIYFRVVGKPGAWRLEEAMYSPAGEGAESRLIRRALQVPDQERIHMLPGREHLLAPAKSAVVLRSGGQTWTFAPAGTVPGSGAAVPAWQPPRPTRAVVVRAGQAIPLALEEALSSATALKGGTVALKVARDVVADGLVAIPAGTRVDARVVEVRRPSFGGSPGMVVLQIRAVVAADGTPIPLSGASGAKTAFSARPGWCLGRGHEVDLAPGAPVSARAARSVAVLAPK